MARLLSNNELAHLLENNQVDRTILDEAARRVRLLSTSVLNKQSSSELSSLASRILSGGDYTEKDVSSLAASVLSQDETSDQS